MADDDDDVPPALPGLPPSRSNMTSLSSQIPPTTEVGIIVSQSEP